MVNIALVGFRWNGDINSGCLASARNKPVAVVEWVEEIFTLLVVLIYCQVAEVEVAWCPCGVDANDRACGTSGEVAVVALPLVSHLGSSGVYQFALHVVSLLCIVVEESYGCFWMCFVGFEVFATRLKVNTEFASVLREVEFG